MVGRYGHLRTDTRCCLLEFYVRQKKMSSPNNPSVLSQQTPVRGVVLVVDDEYVNRAIMCRLLRKAGFDTVEACNGIEALEAIVATEFDLILLDIVCLLYTSPSPRDS